jgi:hypothetical protein
MGPHQLPGKKKEKELQDRRGCLGLPYQLVVPAPRYRHWDRHSAEDLDMQGWGSPVLVLDLEEVVPLQAHCVHSQTLRDHSNQTTCINLVSFLSHPQRSSGHSGCQMLDWVKEEDQGCR